MGYGGYGRLYGNYYNHGLYGGYNPHLLRHHLHHPTVVNKEVKTKAPPTTTVPVVPRVHTLRTSASLLYGGLHNPYSYGGLYGLGHLGYGDTVTNTLRRSGLLAGNPYLGAYGGYGGYGLGHLGYGGYGLGHLGYHGYGGYGLGYRNLWARSSRLPKDDWSINNELFIISFLLNSFLFFANS